MRMRVVPGVVRAMVLAVSLAACGLKDPGTAARIACPTPGLLDAGSDLTRYRPGPVKDLASLEFDARMTGLSGGCNAGRGDRSIEMQVSVGFAVDRGVAATGRSFDLPWFVAVLDRRDNTILSRQLFVERVGFAQNETRALARSQPVTISLPVSEARRATDYRILVSFMLSEDELAQNRERGPR